MANVELYTTNFRVAIEWLNTNLVIIPSLDEIEGNEWYIFGGMITSDELFVGYQNQEVVEDEDLEDEDKYRIPEFDRYFITNLNEDEVIYLCEHFEGFYFYFSEKLDAYILCVSGGGISWDCIMIDTDLPEAKAGMGQHFYVKREIK